MEKPSQVSITDDLLRAVEFSWRIIGIDDSGAPITAPTPARMRDWFIRDKDTPGFAVRITPGAKTFYAQRKLAGKPCRVVLGAWPATRIDKARVAAIKAMEEMAAGIDPHSKKRDAIADIEARRERARRTFGVIFAEDILRNAPAAAPASDPDAPATAMGGGKADKKNTADDRLYIRKCLEALPIWKVAAAELDAGDLGAMLAAVRSQRGVATSLKCWRYARAAWNRQDSKPAHDPFGDWLSKNTLPKVERRQTSLDADETAGKNWLKSVAALRDMEGSRAFSRRVQADYILLALVWGGRKTETAGLLVEDVDFARECVYFRQTKSGRTHAFPLTPGAAALLKRRIEDNNAPRGRDNRKIAHGETIEPSPFVFPSPKRGRHIVDARTALASGKDGSGLKIALHDLRRGFAGAMALDAFSSGGDLSIVKLAMNHASVGSDVTWGYIQPKLKLLRPMYLAHERRVFEAAGLSNLLPEEEKTVQPERRAAVRIRKENGKIIASIDTENGPVEAEGATAAEARDLVLSLTD